VNLTYTYFSNAFNVIASANNVVAGIYNVIGTNSNGCKDTVRVTVTDFAKPSMGADITRSKCVGFSYDLRSNFTNAALTYSYFSNAFSVLARPDSVNIGTYAVIGTNSNGCKDTVIVTVTNNPKPAIGADTIVYHVCANETTNLVTLYNTTGLTVLWNTASPTLASPGNYRLIVTNNFGCTDTALVAVILETSTWTGTVSNDWHNEANWNTQKVPTLQTHVIIPAGTPNICSINNEDAEASSIQVRPTAVLQLSANRKLNITKKCNTLPVN
jgi:hypothetical protein